ncbi:MAG: SpoIIE family protein phosphatase [Planctomycetota bacterium]
MARRTAKGGGLGLATRLGLAMFAALVVILAGAGLLIASFVGGELGELANQRFTLGLVAALGGAAVVGGLAAFVIGQRAAAPIHRLIEDVRAIARGNLSHRTRPASIAEVASLARTIDRMTADLKEAQEAHWELSTRERELELAGEVREALLPLATPLLSGLDLGALHLASYELSGDFHDYVERPDGSVCLLVCDVSGEGVPAALVAGTARAYLRSELSLAADIGEALRRVNRWMSDDVRRGMYVTALVVEVAPNAEHATVACAGHKLPLLRYTAVERSLRVVHPQGIALGFDRGSVFDRRLAVERIEFAPGDRLLLATASAVSIQDPAGAELGEDAFFRRFLARASQETNACLKGLRTDLLAFAQEDQLARNVSLVTVLRTPLAPHSQRS